VLSAWRVARSISPMVRGAKPDDSLLAAAAGIIVSWPQSTQVGLKQLPRDI
jgi:hypothetical protein